jgi:hypothetical protein
MDFWKERGTRERGDGASGREIGPREGALGWVYERESVVGVSATNKRF